jgi:hypothetical protein
MPELSVRLLLSFSVIILQIAQFANFQFTNFYYSEPSKFINITVATIKKRISTKGQAYIL